jgi:hypothetical protein
MHLRGDKTSALVPLLTEAVRFPTVSVDAEAASR